MSDQLAVRDTIDTGLAWIGEIPSHWTVGPLKNLVAIQNGADYKNVEADDGFPVMGSGGPFAYAKNAMYDGETVLLGRKGTIDKPLYYNGPFWAVDTMYWSKISPSANGRFVYYVATTIPFAMYATNTALPSMTKSTLGAHLVAYPSKDEQDHIANWLDRQTARIDTLITKKTRFIELLKEKRQAVITKAVTKGLDDSVEMKDSGVEWIGEVPTHWDVVPLKASIGRIESGVSVNATDTPADAHQLGVLKTSCVYTGQFDATKNKTVVPTELGRVACPVVAGTLIVSRMNTPDLVGAAGLTSSDYDNLFLPDRLWQVFASDGCAAFIHYWTLTRSYRAQVEMACAGTSSSMQNLSQDDFRSFIFPKPPAAEQFAIASFLDKQTTRIDSLIEKTERSIELLKEKRSALITAAVTGKIDVREAA